MSTPRTPAESHRVNPTSIGILALHRSIAVLMLIGALAAGWSLQAQTTFTGSWDEWYVAPVYDYDNDYSVTGTRPYPGPGYVVRGPFLTHVVDQPGATPTEVEEWHVLPILVPAQPAGTFTDNHWSNPQAWSDGLPSSSTNAQITGMHSEGSSIQLPVHLVEGAATARSLTVFDADNTNSQAVTLSSGTLNLTPASVFDTTLRVGVASASVENARKTTLTLDAVTLTSSAYAAIGKGRAVGVGGPLDAILALENGSNWLHPAGLIEIGGGDGTGRLNIGANSLLAGSLLPGVSADPQLTVSAGSHFFISDTGSARLTELHVDSGHAAPTDETWDFGARVNGYLETGLLRIGETTAGAAVYLTYSSTSRLGTVIIEQQGVLFYGGNPSADTVEVRDGSISGSSSFVIGDPLNPAGSAMLLKMAEAADSSASYTMSLGADSIVHGSVLLGGYGTATVSVGTDATLDIRGNATLGRSESSAGGAAGNGSVYVSGGLFRAQNIEVGYSYFDSYSYNPYPSPTGLLSVSGRVEVTGYIMGDGWSMLPDAEGNYAYGPTVEAGSITIGKNGTLNLSASGKVAFTDPTGGAAVRYYGNQRITNYGLIKGGGTAAPALESGGHIDFGAVGGSLVNAGRIAPGYAAGWLTVNGDITFIDSMGMGAGGKLLIELGGTTAGLGYDVLDIWGNADLTGATVEFSLINGYAPQLGDAYTFLLVGGDLTGMFATLVDNTGLGLTLDNLSLVAGGVMLTMPVSAVPEPSTYAMLAGLVALGCVVFVRQRSK